MTAAHAEERGARRLFNAERVVRPQNLMRAAKYVGGHSRFEGGAKTLEVIHDVRLLRKSGRMTLGEVLEHDGLPRFLLRALWYDGMSPVQGGAHLRSAPRRIGLPFVCVMVGYWQEAVRG